MAWIFIKSDYQQCAQYEQVKYINSLKLARMKHVWNVTKKNSRSNSGSFYQKNIVVIPCCSFHCISVETPYSYFNFLLLLEVPKEVRKSNSLHSLKSWHQTLPSPPPSNKRIMKTEKNHKWQNLRIRGWKEKSCNLWTEILAQMKETLPWWIIHFQGHHLQNVFNANISRHTIKHESHLALWYCFKSLDILR